MQTFYCEIRGLRGDNPHFPGYKFEAATPAIAIAWFRWTHGPRLTLVYDEDLNILWDSEAPPK